MPSRDDKRRVRKQKKLPRPGEARPDQAVDERTNALLWLELAQGGIRDALVERLAQAHLMQPAPVIPRRKSEAPRRP